MKKGIEEGMKKGKEEGIEEGIKKGKEKGAREAQLATARRLLDMGLSTEQVCEATGLNPEDV